ncbi:hypothetical protein IWQ56_002968, partial [Coemansia nantahalensis]
MQASGCYPDASLKPSPFLRPCSGNKLRDAKVDLVDWCKAQPDAIPAVGAPAPGLQLPALPPARRRRCTLPSESQRQPSPFFARATQHCDVFGDDPATKYVVCMFPRVDRGFFLSDRDWTCYRRNYFQVSCTFSLLGSSAPQTGGGAKPRTCVVVDNGIPRTVSHFLIGISAQVSSSDRGVELVQHTPKRDKGPQITPQPQPVRPSDSLGSGAHDINASAAVCFERLQFKTATANNGKRRAAQQYYALEVELLAACDDGHCVAVATSTSSPIVVRGRSPGHYADTTRRRNASSSLSSGTLTAGTAP